MARTPKKPAKRQASPLTPVHHSIAARLVVRPQHMDRVKIPHEIRACLARVALDIFTDMTNTNRSFQDALLSIYLSGLAHGADIAKEKKDAPAPVA